MDWSRAKSILIVLFLILNLFLLGGILYTQSISHRTPDFDEAARKILQSRNISISCTIPEAPEKIGRIAYEEGDPSFSGDPAFHLVTSGTGKSEDQPNEEASTNAAIESSIGADGQSPSNPMERMDGFFALDVSSVSPAISGSDADEIRRQVDAWLKQIGMDVWLLRFEGAVERDGGLVLSYRQGWRSGTLFDNRLDLLVRDGRIQQMEGRLRRVKREVGSFSAMSIQQLLIMNSLPSGSTVTGIRFGWKSTDVGVLHDGLVWELTLDDAEVRYFDALTGQEIPEDLGPAAGSGGQP